MIDAVIIGAGIAGTSVAYFLSNHAKVLVLEREAQPGVHSTGRSAALFSESYGKPQIRALTRASRAFFERPPRDFVEHALLEPRGALVVAPRADADALTAEFEAMRVDTPSLQLLDAAATRARVPVLEPEFAQAGMFEPGAMDIDVNSLHQGFMRGLRQRGGRLECGVQILSLEHSQGEWLIEVSIRGAQPQTLHAPLVIDAAGAWADEVAALAGAAPVGLQPKRRSAFTFAAPHGVDVSAWPAVVGIDESFYFKPDAGRLLGSPANADPVAPHDVVPEELDIALGIHAIEQATTLQIRRPASTWAGLRSFVADGEPVIGFDGRSPGFFWLAAQGGYGIQSAAGAAELAASLLLGEALPEALAAQRVEPALFAPQRLR